MAQGGSSGSCGLTDLPLELLSIILENSGWKDILRVRQTCKYLAEASRLFAVWKHQHKGLSMTIPRLLEAPTDYYKSQELEDLFLRWKRSQIGWRTIDGFYGHRRNIVNDDAMEVHLVKGGRWLLTVQQTGCTMYYDLDAETVAGRLLIPDQLEDHPLFRKYRFSSVGVCVDIDETSPILQFNLAFTIARPSDDLSPSSDYLTQIWSVSIVFDDSRRVSGLSANLLASFPRHSAVRFLYSMSLLGRYVAFTARDDGLGLYSLIIEWEKAGRNPSNYPCRAFYSHESRDVRLLPNNRALDIGENMLRLYDYLSVKETTTTEPLNMDTSTTKYLLWEVMIPRLFGRPMSGPFLVRGTTRFVLLADQVIYGLIIDDAVNTFSPPQLMKLLDSPDRFALEGLPILGYYHGLATVRGFGIVLLHYSFPDECEAQLEMQGFTGGLNYFSVLEGQTGQAGQPVMDEGSGRVVLDNPPEIDHRVVHDFSRCI
ncbi:hypothetical protein GALMADRAFT_137676 [Galerina marginata CBS 339.88]|uniref:F-box domain-containing protein n=1 Tax=Galerina marginata (strain CBS 339.88) TaxID=685588 RepID=A0A067T8G0_GALM3|nr:hypothetical protein GALMADRAFT_137676 [Galerina marginata CBS 339.88]